MKGLIAPALLWLLVGSGAVGQNTAPAEERAYLGVQLVTGSACDEAAKNPETVVCVQAVRPGGAAERAGMRPGDVILKLGSVTLTEAADVPAAIQGLRVGRTVDLTVQRAGELVSLSILLDARDTVPIATGTPLDACEATRSSSPGPWTPSFRKQNLVATRAQLEALLGAKQATIDLQGDVLTFVFRGKGDAARLTGGTVQCALDRVGDTDLWALQLQSPEWKRSFLRENFALVRGGIEEQTTAEFRGSEAPGAPSKSARTKLDGGDVPSRILGLSKAVTVYVPDPRPPGPLPVLYLTDGQGLATFAVIADDLIRKGKIRPIALIGVHAGNYNGDMSKPYDLRLDDRAREYLPNVDPPYFVRYVQFFVDELMPWAEQRYGLSSDRKDRAVMGYSNGGAFAEAIGLRRPEAIATVLPFSPAVNDAMPPTIDRSPRVRFLFAAGRFEPTFIANARDGAAKLKSIGIDTVLREYWSGHDTLMWQQAFAEYLAEVFGEKNPVAKGETW